MIWIWILNCSAFNQFINISLIGDVIIADGRLQTLCLSSTNMDFERVGIVIVPQLLTQGFGFCGLVKKAAPFGRFLQQARVDHWGSTPTRIPMGLKYKLFADDTNAAVKNKVAKCSTKKMTEHYKTYHSILNWLDGAVLLVWTCKLRSRVLAQ